MTSKKFIYSLLFVVGFLFATEKSSGQQVYYKEFDARPTDGDYRAYVIKLFADSTIQIENYSMEGMRYEPAFYKTTYTGKYSQKNDTCIILYLRAYSQFKQKNRETKFGKDKNDLNLNFLKTNHTFFVQNGIIFSPTWLFPPLPKANEIEANSLELTFQNWDNPKVQNNPFTKQHN